MRFLINRRWQLFFYALFALFVLVTPIPALRAESYLPFADYRIVDSTGTYYVVVKRQGGPRYKGPWGPVELTIAQRKAGSSPVRPARAKVVSLEGQGNVYEMLAREDVAVRDSDSVHGRVALDTPSAAILVSTTGIGIVLLDLYGLNHTLMSGDVPALKIVSLKGNPAHSIKLESLFSHDEIVSFQRTLSGCLSWWRCAWIDEDRRELIVVGRNTNKNGSDPLASIAFDTGVVRRGGREDVMRAILTRNPGALASALDIAIRWNLREAKPYLPVILASETLPLEARLRAAVLLALLGDKAGTDLMTKSVIKVSHELRRHPDWQDIENERLSGIYAYCVKHLPDLLGDKALPVLHDVARQHDYPSVMYGAFRRIGAKSVPHLVRMLEDNDDPQGQVFAADLLREFKPDTEAAVSALAKALGSSSQSRVGRSLRVASAAALGEIGRPARAALPALLRLSHDENEGVRKAAADAIERIRR